jgi:hypothetical protein
MKIFLSWSGEVSHEVAKRLDTWLPCVLQGVETFLSSDISKGDRWNDVLADELKEAHYGIICVTPFNIHKAWMNFEAGALSRVISRSRVVPLLFHVNPEELDGPLSQFQSTVYQKDDVRAMVRSINQQMTAPLSPEILDRTFDKWWDDLNHQLQGIDVKSGRETRTYYDWLYTRADLANIFDDEYKSVWIVTDEAERYFDQKTKDQIKAACKRGTTFQYFLPIAQAYEYQADLQAFGDAFPGFSFKLFGKDDFESQAPSEYIMLNPAGDGDLKVLVKVPLGEHGPQDYWFKTNDRSARSFVSRFRNLWESGRSSVAAV